MGSFTDEQRAKSLANRMRNKELKEKTLTAQHEQHIELASLTEVANPRERKLLEEISALKKKLGLAETARSEAEQAAINAAQDANFFGGNDEEKPTGKTVTVKRLDGYETVGYKDDGRPILKPKWKDVELPTYAYKINMPPVGGTDLKINSVPFYHGAVYILDLDTLRTVKSMVWNLWAHERQIHGTDENAYRKPTHAQFSGRGYA